ncbi:29798_t:CDS:2 [Racocetra persica]|uniref:29798_t:CDS:1 n=1 Tax=Racocetra persica TaxID=160502 RepID=A0ACA9MDW8_9GLOM|nr:29798_t:CDS:2 [Racocetra persica]
MEDKLLTQLSNDYIKLFKTGEYYDVILRAGQEPNCKEFRVHSLVLRTRSAYFRSALSSNWVQTQGNVMLFSKPNVSPEVFEIILNFLYGGTVCLAEHDARVILDVLKATDEFCLSDLSEYIQNYLLTHPWRLMSHFVFVHRFAAEQSERYLKIRNSLDYVDNELYEKSIQLVSDKNRPKKKDINSILITAYDAEMISMWIKNVSSLPENCKHDFKLILRGSQDGFTPKKFHDHCDGKGPTLTVLREKQSGEILGGYNPLNWYSMVAGSYSPTSSSFIFSLGDKVFNFDRVLSKIVDRNKAIYQNGNYGPCFGGGESDLRLFGNDFNEDIRCRCVKTSYQNKIRNSEDEFCIDELEVFQVSSSMED